MSSSFLHSAKINVRLHIDRYEPILLPAIAVSHNAILTSHLEYLKVFYLRGRSRGWCDKSVQAIRLLLDYAIVHKELFENPKKMFATFALRIFEGTLDDDGDDLTDLRWKPRSSDTSNRIIKHITNFSDWLYDNSGSETLLLNPLVKASKAQMIINLAAFNHKKNNSFLGHTYSDKLRDRSVFWSREVESRKVHVPDFEPNKAFPDELIWDLLQKGFMRRGASINEPPENKYNLNALLITMLLHFGGIRTSEAFHIYVDDIIPNIDEQQIRIYHPSKGLAPEWYRHKTNSPHCNRQTYLRDQFGLKPRYRHSDKRYAAGWKDPAIPHVGGYFNVYLFGDKEIHSLFFELFRAYLLKQRVKPLKGREHPFLFTNHSGDPLSMQSFRESHRRAIERIGLVPKLDHGGTPHCHRHAYGTRLSNSGIDQLTIKHCLHHSSLHSQEVYKALKPKQISAILEQSTDLLKSKASEFI